MIEATSNYYTVREAWEILASRFRRRSPAPEQQVEVLQPVWTSPTTEIERAVYAALILAGEPVNNRRLAELMDCSPGEASRRVAQLVQAELGSAKTAAIRKARKGREVLINLH